MSEPSKPDSNSPRAEDERLAHALISRGLITREEVIACRGGQPLGAERLLERLVEKGLLTTAQADRVRAELPGLINQHIPGYQLMDKLGQGSMGVVYKARQVSMNRLVAVKVLSPRWVSKPEFLDRLRREAHLAARLSHNNIVQAIDVGSAGNFHYFIMEYVEGKTIRDELDAGKVYSETEAVEIILQLAQALQHAHRRGLIHRDIKPANVILTAEGIAKLADLGMARETADAALARKERGITIGTPYYIAPEQARGREDIDGRADLYSLGATLYHMVTGRPPFPYKDVESVIEAHLHEELTPPDHLRPELSSGLGEVVELLMAKECKQRYQNPGDLVIDLECLLNGEPPRLARQKIEAATLAALSEGEEETEDGSPGETAAGPGWTVVYVLAGALALSLVLNLVLLLHG
jgi:eukaryotic-like serine/threonine-protein kinase